MKIRRVSFTPDEFLVGIQSLTVDEIGFYWVACSLIYSKGGPIDADSKWLGRNAGCSSRMARSLVDRLLAKGKLSLDNRGRLTNGRAVREIKSAESRSKVARTAGETSANVRRTPEIKRPVSRQSKDLGRRGVQQAAPTNQKSVISNHSNHESDARARRDREAPRARDEPDLRPVAKVLADLAKKHRTRKP